MEVMKVIKESLIGHLVGGSGVGVCWAQLTCDTEERL